MKKVLLAMVASIALLAGCSDGIKVEQPADSGNVAKTVQYSQRKEQLAFLKQNSTYQLTEEQMEDSLKKFVKTASENGSRSLCADDNYIISNKSKKLISVKNPSSSVARVASASEETSEYPIYTYEIYNKDTDKSAVAITSTDLRLGSVLAVTEEGDLDDDEVKAFADIFYSKLNDYILETNQMWDEVSANESAARSYVDDLLTVIGVQCSYSDFKELQSCTNTILKTNWDQTYPYNKLVVQATGNPDYVTGCAVTALAQIMAGLEYNEGSILLASGYNWNAMKADPYAWNVSTDAQDQIAHLMLYLGLNLAATYNIRSTSVTVDNIKAYLTRALYTHYDSDFTMLPIIQSLDLGFPLLCIGTDRTLDGKENGHCWVIDGYKGYACTMKNDLTGAMVEIADYFVHCNLGWGGISNGYYRSCIFNTQKVPIPEGGQATDEFLKRFYKYNLYTISHISHIK